MIESRTFLRVTCDDCGSYFSLEGEGYTVFETDEEMRDAMTAPWDAWTIKGDKQFCPRCAVFCETCGEQGHWDEDCPKPVPVGSEPTD